MGLSLGDLYTSSLLMLNAIAVLHEERFLAKHGWSTNSPEVTLNPSSLKSKEVVGCIHKAALRCSQPRFCNAASTHRCTAKRCGETRKVLSIVKAVRLVMTWPLIVLNILTVLFKLILG